jgi:uncharacterized protein YybS (DUF2232 family)
MYNGMPFSFLRVSMRLTDIFGCVGGALVLLYASLWIPILGPLLALLSPLLFLSYATRLGLQRGLILAGLSVMAVSVISGLTGHRQAVVFCVEFSFMGIVLAELFRRKLTLGLTITAALGAMTVFGAIMLFGLGAAQGLEPSEMISTLIKEQLQPTVQLYRDLGTPVENGGGTGADGYAEIFVKTLIRIYPSLMVIGMGLVIWFNVMLAGPVFKRLDLAYPQFQPGDRWQAPERLIWGLIIAGFGSLLATGTLQIVAINLLIVLAVVYFFQGLSIAVFYLNKYNINIILKIILYFLVIIQQFFMLLLAILGVFDQWLDFRRIRKNQTD